MSSERSNDKFNLEVMKKILVTGGAGFVGSHLCEYLLKRGNRVICLDNYYTGSLDNIFHLVDNVNFEVVCQDIVKPYFEQVDEIYNLACPASPVHYQSNPIATTKTSVLGLLNMLELAAKCRAKVLQASTSEVYGDPSIHPQREDYWGNVNPIGVRSCYDEGKRCSETLCMDYRRQYGLNTKIIRIFNTYGPRMHPNDGRVVSNFIIQALKGEDLTIYGDGSQTRSFQYVDDLIVAMTRFMDTDSSLSGPVNIGNPIEFTILELAELVLELTNSKSKITYLSLPNDDPRQRKPDIDYARLILDNWSPEIHLREGLLKTIDYFRVVV